MTTAIIPTSIDCDQQPHNVFVSPALAATILDALNDVREVTAIADRAAYEAAGERFRALQAVSKSVEDKRVEIKAPALLFCTTLDGHAKRIQAEIDPEIQRVGRLTRDWKTADDARIAREIREAKEAAEKAQRELEAKAEAERQRRQVEANELYAKQVALIEEDRKLAMAAGEDPMPVDYPRFTVVDAILVEQPRYIAPVVAYQKPVKSLTRSAPAYTLKVVDRALIPKEIGGQPLWTLDEALCLKLLKLKIAIPGLALDTTDGIAPTGR